MTRFLAPALLMLPLLGGAPTEAAPLSAQTEDRAIVKVAEWCGADSFRDEYGHCRHFYGAHEACPPDRHFEPWVYHQGGRCVLN